MKKIGLLGCGLMGSGILQVSASSGFETFCVEVKQEQLDKGKKTIEKSLGKFVEKGKMTADDREKILGRIHMSLNVNDLADCDLVIEAIDEIIDEKCRMFRKLDEICKKDTIFASNTSSLSIIEMAAATKRPDQFVGLHFFNPVPMMKLVEVIRTLTTSDQAFDKAFEFAQKVGKDPIKCKDNTGFVVNLLLIPYLMDAIRAVERNVASVEDIDKGMRLGCAHPMGPLALLDFVGLDTTFRIGEIMFNEYRDPKYAPPSLLRKMVHAGFYGRKSGRGFYDYSGDKPQVANLSF